MHTLPSVNCYYFHIILSTWVSPSKDKDLFCTLVHKFTQHRHTALWNTNICPAFAAAFFLRLIFPLLWGCEVPHICQALALNLTCSSIAFSESPCSFNTLLPREQGFNSHRASPPFLFWCLYWVFLEMCPHLKVTDVFSVVSQPRSSLHCSPTQVGDLFQARHWHHPLKYRLRSLAFRPDI